MKKRKRKPRGFWAKKENQKAFLDSLLRKYNIRPEKLTSTMIRNNGGRRLEAYYENNLEMLEAHYGEISLLDLPRVPWSAWKDSKNRIEAVREAVERLGKRPERVRKEDLCRVGLDGLIAHSGMGIRELMREAGYDVADYVSWQAKKTRVKKIRELVEKAGGTDRVTLTYIKERARGLVEYYDSCNESVTGHWSSVISKLPEGLPVQKGLAGEYIPILYWILKDAGYDVMPDDCLRGLDAWEDVVSLHGHSNHSLAEALVDDWIYDFAGRNHMHDVIYPGQRKTKRYAGKDCDFVLFPLQAGTQRSEVRGQRTICPSSSLWIEYAGIWHKGKSRFVKIYKRRIREKKALAKKAGIPLVVITPARMADPEDVWEEVVSKAPWLKKRRRAAMGSRFLEWFCGDSDV